MAYEVTATRKRPQNFHTIAGQKFVVSTLSHAIEQGHIAHAYLFSGPRGVGKTTSARILAKALNCENGPTASPCGECSHCKEIKEGNSVDVIEIDGASNTSVNDIRRIKDEVLFPPQSSRYKIYIIDEVHMLSISAFNALLKTVEEPPEYIVFIFATTEPQKVPATIRSRCQQFNFRLIELNTIIECLSEAASDMGVSAEKEALFWIAKEATGSMRDAYTLFDQVVSFSGDSITMEKIKTTLNLVSSDQINTMVKALLNDDKKQAILILRELLSSGVSVNRIIKTLCEYFRTLMLLKHRIENEEILGMSPSSIDPEIRDAYTAEQLQIAFDSLIELYRDIRYSINPAFELELAVAKLGDLHHTLAPSTLVKQLKMLQAELLNGESALPPSRQILKQRQQKKTEPVKKPEPVKKKAAPKPAPRPEPVSRPEVKPEPVKKKAPVEKHTPCMDDRKALNEYFASVPMMGPVIADIVSFEEKDGITITFEKKFCYDQACSNRTKMQKGLLEVCGYEGKLNFTLKKNKPTSSGPTSRDETISGIAKLFRGKIIGEKKYE